MGKVMHSTDVLLNPGASIYIILRSGLIHSGLSFSFYLFFIYFYASFSIFFIFSTSPSLAVFIYIFWKSGTNSIDQEYSLPREKKNSTLYAEPNDF